MSDYFFGRPFQLKLLAALVRRPKKFLSIIEPQYFRIPVFIDLARIARDAYKKYGTDGFRIQRDSLLESIKRGLSSKNRQEYLADYKEVIGEIWKEQFRDLPLLREQAASFMKDTKYREALVKAEGDLNNGQYEAVHQRMDDLRNAFANDEAGPLALKWSDFIVKPGDEQPATWLIEDLIPAEAITLISGKRGDYKTYLAIALGKAVACGDDFLGWPTQERRVLFLNRDNPKVVFMKRLIRQFHLGPDTKKFGHWSLWFPKGEPPKLDSGDHRLRAIARKYKPLIIFDSLRRFSSKEENSSTEMAPIFEECRKLIVLGATVVILHNLGKDEKSGPRGTTDMGDAVDMLYEIKVRRDTNNPKHKLLYVTTKKDRVEGREGKQFILRPLRIRVGSKETFLFRLVGPEQVHGKERRGDEDIELLAKLRALRQDNPEIAERELAEELRVTRYKVRTLLETKS